jgi:hypothetical protein
VTVGKAVASTTKGATMKIKLVSLVAVLAAVLFTSLAPAGATDNRSNPQTVNWGDNQQIQGKETRKCFRTGDAAPHNRETVFMAHCNRDDSWSFGTTPGRTGIQIRHAQAGRTYTVKVGDEKKYYNRYCLGVNPANKRVHVFQCVNYKDKVNTSQLWDWHQIGGGAYQLRNRQYKLCIEANNADLRQPVLTSCNSYRKYQAFKQV